QAPNLPETPNVINVRPEAGQAPPRMIPPKEQMSQLPMSEQQVNIAQQLMGRPSQNMETPDTFYGGQTRRNMFGKKQPFAGSLSEAPDTTQKIKVKTSPLPEISDNVKFTEPKLDKDKVVLYHVTDVDSADKIMKEGFRAD